MLKTTLLAAGAAAALLVSSAPGLSLTGNGAPSGAHYTP
jgi:hypothetical protein